MSSSLIKTGMITMIKTALLLQYNNVGFRYNTCKSFDNKHIQDNSQYVLIMAL